MKTWLRRLRGAVGLGLTWAAPFFGVGVLVALAGWDFGVDAFGSGALWLAYNSLLSAATGFICGGTFSAFLSLTQGRRRFDQMSLPGFAVLGGVGGAVAAVALGAAIGWGVPSVVANVVILGLLGAGAATGTLVVARQSDDRELLEASDEIASIGLSPDEAKRLLSDP